MYPLCEKTLKAELMADVVDELEELEEITHSHWHVHPEDKYEHVHWGRYMLINSKKMGMAVAKEACVSYGGALASVSTMEQNDEIHNMITKEDG